MLIGMDSVLTMLQMPDGVPVAIVSVNGARNAAILASQIIGLHNEDALSTRLFSNGEWVW